MTSQFVRRPLATVAILASVAVAAPLVTSPSPASATPVIAGFAATGSHRNSECRYEWCALVSFRAWEPDQYRTETLKWRVLIYRAGDRGLIGNWNGTLKNDTQVNRWMLYPKWVMRKGRYIARLVVTSGRGTAKKDRFFRVT